MATAENALIQLEEGVNYVPATALTDSGDHRVYTFADDVLSSDDTYERSIVADGIVSGLNLLSAATANDTVDYADHTCKIGGADVVVTAGSIAATRPTVNDYKISLFCVQAGGTVHEVEGTEGTEFSETRGAAGGPPYVPLDEVCLGEVRMDSKTAAPLTAAEIKQIPNVHAEFSGYPVLAVNPIGQGKYSANANKVNAYVEFSSALPAVHTGDTTKKVYGEYYTPQFGDLARAMDFAPAETSYSASSTQYYGGTINSQTSSLGQCTFTAMLDDGVNDSVVAAKGKTRTVKFFPNRNKTAYLLTQGKVAGVRSYSVSDQIKTDITITPDYESAEFSG